MKESLLLSRVLRNADMATILGLTHGRIVPHDRTDEQLAGEPLGTGPFKVEEYIPGERTMLVRNEDY